VPTIQTCETLEPVRAAQRRRVSSRRHTSPAKSQIKSQIFSFLVQYLNVTGQWEIFSEWVTFEAVIGENATQVGVIGEEHAIHVPNFAFIPIGSFENLAT
jgi:hypothetical protein